MSAMKGSCFISRHGWNGSIVTPVTFGTHGSVQKQPTNLLTLYPNKFWAAFYGCKKLEVERGCGIKFLVIFPMNFNEGIRFRKHYR